MRTPRYFALVRTPNGVHPTLELRAVRTGALVRTLGSLGPAWTNSGLAFSPDGRSVYLTLLGHLSLHIERVDVATGNRSIVADGEQPAISFTGRELAYAAGGFASTELAVRDLISGRERRIDLRPLLGRSYELLNSSIAWTRDGSAIIVLAPHVAFAYAGRRGPGAPDRVAGRGPACRASSPAACLIEIRASRSRPLKATRLRIPITDRGVTELAQDGAHPEAVFLSRAVGLGDELDQVTFGQSGPRVRLLVALRKALLVAVDPTGSRVLYLNQGRRPALWRARVRGGRLIQRRELIPSVWLEAASW